jgi:hypothetical protein
MDQIRLLKQVAQTLDDFSNKLKVMHARCEDVQFRAQRLASWLKNQTNIRATPPDRAFPDDLKALRRDLKRAIQEFDFVPGWLARIERAAEPQPDALDFAVKITRSASQFQQMVMTLLSPIQIAHNHLKVAELKIDAWFLAQDIEAWGKEIVAVPLRCHKILHKIEPNDPTPPPPGTEGLVLPEAPAGPPEDLERPV